MEFLKRHSLLFGIFLMFLFTWPIDLGVAAKSQGLINFSVPDVLVLWVGYGFVAASLLMTALTLGKKGVASLLKRFLIWRVGWKWYLTILIVPLCNCLAVLIALALHRPVDFTQAFG